MPDFVPGGWLIDEEDFEQLASLPGEAPFVAMAGSVELVAIDPRKVIQIPNQQRQGSCVGHGLTTAMEWCHILQTKTFETQLSRAMGYYESQRESGITNDRGSTVSGAVKLSKKTGVCEESLWPYPSSYNNKRPSNWTAVVDNAEKYKIGQSYNMTSYDGISTFLGAGQGGVVIGIGWNGSVNRAVVESYSGGGGGHALAFIALSERKDSSGRQYLWLANSWGTSWGNKGWAEVAPKAVEQMLSTRNTTMIGISDMPNAKPRKVDWLKESPWLR